MFTQSKTINQALETKDEDFFAELETVFVPGKHGVHSFSRFVKTIQPAYHGFEARGFFEAGYETAKRQQPGQTLFFCESSRETFFFLADNEDSVLNLLKTFF